MDKELIKKEARQFLKAHKTMVIATSSSSNEPQASTVYYVIDDDFNFYFITGNQTRKFKNLIYSKLIAFVVGEGPEVTTVQGGGETELLKYPYSEDIIVKISESVSLKESKYWPIIKLPEGEAVIFKIKPKWMVMVNLDINKPEIYEEDFFKIIP